MVDTMVNTQRKVMAMATVTADWKITENVDDIIELHLWQFHRCNLLKEDIWSLLRTDMRLQG